MALNAYLNSMSTPYAYSPHVHPDPFPSLLSHSFPLSTTPLTPPPEKVTVLTQDGRTLIGILTSCDGSMNLVLADTMERIIRPADEGVPSEEVPLGLYIIRGDSVAVCGRVDEEVDGKIDWSKVHGEALGGMKHV